jgi:hypothetical protein
MGRNAGVMGAVIAGALLASLAQIAWPTLLAGQFLTLTLIASIAVYLCRPARLVRRRRRRPAFADILPPRRRSPPPEVTRDQLSAYFERISDPSGN